MKCFVQLLVNDYVNCLYCFYYLKLNILSVSYRLIIGFMISGLKIRQL